MKRASCTFAMICLSVMLAASPAVAAHLGEAQSIDPAGGWNPDVAFDPDHGLYLVVWTGAEVTRGRLIDRNGSPASPVFPIHDSVGGSRFPAVAYSRQRSEFLVTWDSYSRPGEPDTIWGQRVRSPDGVLMGGNFRIAAHGSVRSAVAWGSVSQCYMVIYGLSNVYARRVSGSGAMLGEEISVSAAGWYPTVSYSSATDSFLASWDDGSPGIAARRYAAQTGQPLGAAFQLSPGAADRSHSTYDPQAHRWLVQYQDQSLAATQSYDQFVRFVNDDGTLGPGPFPTANTPDFEGETNLGCDIAFSDKAGAYLSVFGSNEGVFGQLLDRNGTKRRARITVGTGDFTFHSNAADPLNDRFLTVFSGSPAPGGPWHAYYRLYALYVPVANLASAPQPGRIRLTWDQPADADMTEVMIRFSTSSTPGGPDDGDLAAQLSVAPGASASFIHAGLDHNSTYYYAVFAYDGKTPAYSMAVAADNRPGLPGDLDGDQDVDQNDFGTFQCCLSGIDKPYPGGCASADLEGRGDGDVDEGDFEVLRNCMGGSDQPPGC